MDLASVKVFGDTLAAQPLYWHFSGERLRFPDLKYSEADQYLPFNDLLRGDLQ